MSGIRHRRKGDRIERELVHRHRELGLRCERVPMSGACRYRGDSHDLDLYLDGPDAPPAAFESKARQTARASHSSRRNGSRITTACSWGRTPLIRSWCCPGRHGRRWCDDCTTHVRPLAAIEIGKTELPDAPGLN